MRISPEALATVGKLRQRIPEEALRFVFARGGGPGGQNVNKVNSRVTVLLGVPDCAELSEEEKSSIVSRLGRRVSSDGVLSVTCGVHRTQLANRMEATQRLYGLIARALMRPKPRRPTQATKGSRERRLKAKRLASERKVLRRKKHWDSP